MICISSVSCIISGNKSNIRSICIGMKQLYRMLSPLIKFKGLILHSGIVWYSIGLPRFLMATRSMAGSCIWKISSPETCIMLTMVTTLVVLLSMLTWLTLFRKPANTCTTCTSTRWKDCLEVAELLWVYLGTKLLSTKLIPLKSLSGTV